MQRIDIVPWEHRDRLSELRSLINACIYGKEETIMLNTEGGDLTKEEMTKLIEGLPEDKFKIKGPLSPLAYNTPISKS